MRKPLVVAFASLPFLAGCNSNNLEQLPGHLTANPSALDYGSVHEAQPMSLSVVLKNEGAAGITVTGLEIVPQSQFELGPDVPTAAAPWAFGRGDWKPVTVNFSPIASGDAQATLKVYSNDPVAPEIDVPLNGRGIHTQTDTFSQTTAVGGLADILFMVDNSGSMSDKQAKLAASFDTFINWLTTKNVDYHIAITTTDMDDPAQQGRFHGSPKVIDNTTSNVAQTFETNVMVGDGGSGTEQGFAAVSAALAGPLATSENAGFLRTAAKLFVVYVSDEDDQSPGSVSDQINAIRAVKGGDASKVFFSSIGGPPPLGCFTFSGSADSTPRYKQIVDNTQGLWGSICDQNFGTTLQNLAFQVTAAQGSFVLTMQPDMATIQVFVDGVLALPDHWVYDASSNSISFVDPWVPPGNAHVTISYDVL